MGLGVAGLASSLILTGFLLFLSICIRRWTTTEDMTIVLETLAGFLLGAESIAFCKSGGIYTKAAM
jgi:K(+)-stimulated pyrophosphate-energized sodium pump